MLYKMLYKVYRYEQEFKEYLPLEHDNPCRGRPKYFSPFSRTGNLRWPGTSRVSWSCPHRLLTPLLQSMSHVQHISQSFAILRLFQNCTVFGILGLAHASPNGRIIVARPELAQLSDWRKGRSCLW